METILEDFEKYFEIIPANTESLKSICHELRYQVYCVENRFLDIKQYSDKIEIDEYDQHSVHSLLFYRPMQAFIATVRIILFNPKSPNHSFPIENFEILRRTQRDKLWKAPRDKLGEISRFAVTKQFRRRANEAQLTHGITERLSDPQWHQLKRWYPHITLGLFKAVVQLSMQNNVNYWYAVMEPSLIRLLARVGIHFTPVGPLLEYHGMRQPCIGIANKIIDSVHDYRYDVWEFVLSDIAHQQLLVE